MELKCIYKPGELVYEDGFYFDQLSGTEKDYYNWDYWFHANQAIKYLKNKYGITTKQYYNIVMYGDINYQATCEKCGGPVEFYKLSRGYSQYCCASCSSSDIMSNLNKQWWAGKRDNPYINSIEQFAWIERSTLLNRDLESGIRFRYFYIVFWNDRFKIGTYQDGELEELMGYLNNKYSDRNSEIIYYDDNVKVIETECKIKVLNTEHRLLDRGVRGWTETFEMKYYQESSRLIDLKLADS